MGANSSSIMSRAIQITEPHYVLKTPIQPPFPSNTEHCVFATGCFWGSEKSFWRMPGVYTTSVGYAGGHVENPTYQQVCTGRTGHTEAVYVVWDPAKLSFADLVRMYLQCHNPTQVNGQGNDRGTQYRTAFYYETEDQKEMGLAAIAHYEKIIGRKCACEVKALDGKENVYYFAEQYHQQYLARPGSRPYCSAMPLEKDLVGFEEWCPKHLQEKYKPKLSEDYWKKYAPTFHCVLRDPDEQIKWP